MFQRADVNLLDTRATITRNDVEQDSDIDPIVSLEVEGSKGAHSSTEDSTKWLLKRRNLGVQETQERQRRQHRHTPRLTRTPYPSERSLHQVDGT